MSLPPTLTPTLAPTLADGSLLLHLGPQKTGSTAIQRAMHLSRERLAGLGVFYPGPSFRPAEAGWAAMGIGSAVGRPPPRIELWEQLVADVRATDLPRICVSDEDFARATPEAAARITADLGADRIHLVYVARRLDKLLPSHWQERVKSRMTWSYPDFLARMAAPDEGHWEWSMMWAAHDVATVLDRWSAYVPREQITVVVSDEADHDLIPRTFTSMLGLPEGTLQAPADKNNRSLTYAEAEAVRRVNQVFADNGWTGEQYWRIVQAGIAGVLKASERTADVARPPGLPADVLAVVDERSEAQAAAIEAAGVHVVGEPDSLRTRGRVQPETDPVDVEQVSMELFAHVVTGAVRGALDLQRRELKRRRRPAPGLDGVAGRDLARELGGRVRRRIGRRSR
ncbi:hypothetical protein D9V37_00185 [Nocardioides mangrovicus]|uniref:Sulfotransferase family protein n=1 Tax=Nocardioides mangrovicus TaxID=2478913 RepID=A0A3L8P6U4_9ACTN|nr:hypothetical protein [Nocardioides mangrovicus]RLV50453.1 hypothetical protein D9V37_00185 [Nocardioides mangrovicus]